jgi:anti-anti-sigma regulatory factor
MATAMSGYRFFTTEQIGDATIARPVDPHLQGTALAELVKLELLQIFEATACKTAIVDFQNVKLISSSVISSMLGVKRQLSASGVPFLMCGMSDSLRYVFRTLNMDGNVFNIVDDVSEALSGTSKASSYSYYDVCGRLSPPDEENA